MNYDVELPTRDHEAEWFEHVADDGGIVIHCEPSGEYASFIVSAGWAHFEYCPCCGSEIELTTEEVV